MKHRNTFLVVVAVSSSGSLSHFSDFIIAISSIPLKFRDKWPSARNFCSPRVRPPNIRNTYETSKTITHYFKTNIHIYSPFCSEFRNPPRDRNFILSTYRVEEYESGEQENIRFFPKIKYVMLHQKKININSLYVSLKGMHLHVQCTYNKV